MKEGGVTHEGLITDVSTADVDISTNALEDLVDRNLSVGKEEKKKKKNGKRTSQPNSALSGYSIPVIATVAAATTLGMMIA